MIQMVCLFTSQIFVVFHCTPRKSVFRLRWGFSDIVSNGVLQLAVYSRNSYPAFPFTFSLKKEAEAKLLLLFILSPLQGEKKGKDNMRVCSFSEFFQMHLQMSSTFPFVFLPKRRLRHIHKISVCSVGSEILLSGYKAVMEMFYSW